MIHAKILVLAIVLISMPRMMNVRMGRDGCRTAGWIRIGFATLAIVDRLLLHLDLDYFLSPKNGLLPIDQDEEGLFGLLSLLRYVGDSDTILWSMHYLGLINALLLLLGIAPRLNAFALFINKCSFDHAHWMLPDGIDTGLNTMARLFNFHLLFLPLHHITIYDGFGRKEKPANAQDDTWPMWTVWLWQWQTVLIFFGAMMCKFDGDHWTNGTAMYYIMHCTDECIGFFNPDILFNRALPSKLVTWSALCIEVLSPVTIWFCGLPRNLTLVAVTMFLFGMDISMTMHTFEWYGVLGWYLFLIQKKQEKGTPAPPVDASGKRSIISFLRVLFHGTIFTFVLGMAFSMAFPLETIVNTTPHWVSERAEPLLLWQMKLNEYVFPISYKLGIDQNVWSLYCGGVDGTTNKLSVEATLTNGTIVTWHSPNWQDLGRWEHKRLYNHMSYYKHITDCNGRCVEQVKLLSMLTKTYYKDVKEELEYLQLWKEIEYPPEPPENLEWWEPLRQHLIKRRWPIMYVEFGDDYHMQVHYHNENEEEEEEEEEGTDYHNENEEEEEEEEGTDYYNEEDEEEEEGTDYTDYCNENEEEEEEGTDYTDADVAVHDDDNERLYKIPVNNDEL